MNNKDNKTVKTERAIFASGCFWGTEYHFNKKEGVISTAVGYIGGRTNSPTYEDVKRGDTGHAEAVEVIFNPKLVSYEDLVKLFFETHNPSQTNGQGPDIGNQYRSEIFYIDKSQKDTAFKIIKILEDKGYFISTKVTKASEFWKAEVYHQLYYDKSGGTPYCHSYQKRF